MSLEILFEYVLICDGCRRHVTVKEADKLPASWLLAIDEHGRMNHLCKECRALPRPEWWKERKRKSFEPKEIATLPVEKPDA